MKRVSRVLLIILLFLIMFSCTNKKKEEIHIFYTSDVHCGYENGVTLPGLKALVDDSKKDGKNTLLVDCGDFIQGGNLGALTSGESIVSIMNLMDYDVVTFGNHEFDYGIPRLKELIGEMNFDLVISNDNYSGNNESVFENIPEYIIKDINGTKIGFIGVLTPKTITSSTPKYFMEDDKLVYDFGADDSGEKLASIVQSVVDEISNKVDYIIALSHLGSLDSYRPIDAISLIRNTNGIDAVIDGHSHSVIVGETYPNKDGKDVLLTSVGTQLENVGEMIIDSDGNISSLLISEYDRKDETIQNKIDEENNKINELLSEYITSIDFDLRILNENNIRQSRNREVNIGDFVCDAFRSVGESDIAIINGGALRSNIDAGEVTYGSILSVLPFGNTLVTIEASGQQVLDLLEFGAQRCETLSEFDGGAVGEFGGFIQVSGLKYTINTDIETPVKVNGEGTLISIEGNRRVSDVYVLENGEYVPIDVDKTYKVVGADYVLLNSGDGNTVMEGCKNISEKTDLVIDVIKEYILLNNGIDKSYADVSDRITIK